MAIIGRNVEEKTSNNPLRLNGRGLASFWPAVPSNGWVIRYGGVLGKTDSSVNDNRVAWLGHYMTDVNRSPSSLQGYTKITGISKDIGGDTGRNYKNTVTSSVYGGIKVPLFAGSFVAIAAFADHDVSVGVKKDNGPVYKRNGGTPTLTFGTTSADADGSLDLYIEWQPNSAPSVPASLLPVHGTVTINATPTFSGNFTDADTSLGDAMSAVHIQVINKASKTVMWDVVIPATGSSWSQLYTGTALSVDTYQWRVRVADYFTTWSAWSVYADLIIAEGPRVDEATAPSGKQETLTPGPFTAPYLHSLGSSYNRVDIEIWNASNGAPTTLRNTATIVASGISGSTISIPWQVGWTALEWSKEYLVRIRARDTANFISPWSTYHNFNTNYAPTTPANLTPNTTLPRSARPVVTSVASDVDDTVGTGLGVRYRIKGPANLSNLTFTGNITGWTTTRTETGMASTNSYDAADGVAALGSLKMAATATAATAGNQIFVALGDNIPVVPGEVVRYGHSRKNSAPASIRAKIGLLYYQADGTTLIASLFESVEIFGTSYTQPTNTWETKTFTATVPTGASFARLCAVAETVGTSGSANLWFDDYFWDSNNARYLRSASLRAATTDTWDYTITATDAAVFGIYKYDAQSFDGSYTSPWSSESQFNYQQGPTITTTAPTAAAVLTTVSPTVTWTTSSDQGSYHVTTYDAVTGALVYDSGVVSSASLSHVIPVGYLHHLGSYRTVVESSTTLGLAGTATDLFFSVSLTLPATPTNFTASAVPVGGDELATAILLSWDVVNTPAEKFVEYTITREIIGGAEEEESLILRRISAVGQNTFTDLFPASEVSYRYTLRQVYMVATDQVESLATEAIASVTLRHVIISSAAFGTDLRASLRYTETNNIEHVGDREFLLPWGETEPTVYIGPAHYDVISGTYSVISDRYNTARESISNLRIIDNERIPVCYRDERGRKAFAYMDMSEKDARISRYEIDLTLTEINYQEGEP